jgi:hypothetical protein
LKLQIRVFYLSQDNLIQEYAYSKGLWYNGKLSSTNFQAYSQSKLAATFFESKNQIRLYYQLSNSTIQELSYAIGGTTKEWVNLPSEFLPKAKLGSGLAAINFLQEQLRLYYQNEDYMIAEMAWPKRLIFGSNNDTWTGGMSLIILQP